MLRGKQADGEQRVRSADTSKPPPVMPTACAHKGMRVSVCVSGCCAGSERMLRRKRADGAWGGRRVARRGLADAARGGAASGVRIASRRCAGTIFGSLEL